MIDVNKLKEGVTFVEEGQPYRVVKYSFSKMGRGKANIKVRVRNLFTGAVIMKSYLSGNVVEEIELEKKHLQYLYRDDDKLYLMDQISFEQTEVNKEIVGSDIDYLVEGEKVWVLYWGDKILGVELPASVILEVVDSGVSEKGNSVSNVLKPVKLNSGLTVNAPLFIREGDKLKVNTQTGEYIGRVNLSKT